ncbi:MAG: methyltransferase domain-containing protein [Planctomycetota bacterium]
MFSSRMRENLVERREETWRPPLMSAPQGTKSRFLAAVRRWFDLQAGSIWNDLQHELAQASGKVVDVGCGGQPYRCLLPKDVDYCGIDTIDAKAHFGYGMPNTVYYSGDVWPPDHATADIVLLTETLEHVFDVSGFVAEARRCLRPNGRLIMTVPFSARWHFIPHDYWRFTPSCLKRLLERADFGDIVVRARGNAVTVACYKVMALMLPFVFPSSKNFVVRIARRFVGLLLAPLFVFLAIVANVSLGCDGGDDCLGYTVTAHANSAQRGNSA